MTSAEHGPTVLCVDLGKTSSRAVLANPAGILLSSVLGGVPFGADGGTASAERIKATIALLPTHQLEIAVACGVGAAGILTNPSAGQDIANALHSALKVPTAVASDIITAHLGAFSGSPGVALVVGTGAVAIGLNSQGDLRRIDGWGPDIGDLGGGSWIGREGFRAVLGAATGRCAPTTLGIHLDALTSGGDPVLWAVASHNPAQQLASFVPAILDEAERGDAVALGITERAIAHLCSTAIAAEIGTATIAVLGGLTKHAWFSSQLESQLSAAGLTVKIADGDALAGALLAAIRSDLPHERHIHRA